MQNPYLKIPRRHDCPRRTRSHGLILTTGVGREEVTAPSGHPPHKLHGRYGNLPQTRAPLPVPPPVPLEGRRNLDELPVLASASILQRHPRLLLLYLIPSPSQGRGGHRTSLKNPHLKIHRRHYCPWRTGNHGLILAPGIGRDEVTAATGQLTLDPLHDLPRRYGNRLQMRAPLLVLIPMPLEERRNLDEIPVLASEPLLRFLPFLKTLLSTLIGTRTTRSYGAVYSELDRSLAKVLLVWTIV